MTILLVCLSFFLLLGQSVAQREFRVCDGQQLQVCQAVFNDELQIEASLGPLTYQQLLTAVQNVWANNGAVGLQQTCQAFKSYKTCFQNSQEYFNCADNPLGLLVDVNGTATGITQAQAYGYNKIFNQFDFACGSGFMGFANNDVCGSLVFNTRMNDLNNCYNSFNSNVAANPQNVCSFVSVAKDCVANIFASSCSQIPEMAWWGCQYELAGTQVNYPQCTQIFCTYNERR